MTCLTCNSDSVAGGFCKQCAIRMVPKPYPCIRCGKNYSVSHFEVACEKCRSMEESEALVAKWDIIKLNT